MTINWVHRMAETHYKVLGVSPNATQDEIKARYRLLVLKHHPDVSDASDAQHTFLKLQEAFDILSDEQNRALYDEELRVANAPLYRGEPWPTKKYKYTKRGGDDKFASSAHTHSSHNNDGTKKHNIPEWERMHYGIGQVHMPSNRGWPTGESEDDLTNHQLYFKHRAERLAKGGQHPWTTNSKKFSTVSLTFWLKRVL